MNKTEYLKNATEAAIQNVMTAYKIEYVGQRLPNDLNRLFKDVINDVVYNEVLSRVKTQSMAAKALGINRNTLRKRLNK